MFSTRKEKRPDAQISVTYCTYTSPSLPAAGLSPTLHTFSSIHLCEIHLSDLLLRHRTLQTVFVFWNILESQKRNSKFLFWFEFQMSRCSAPRWWVEVSLCVTFSTLKPRFSFRTEEFMILLAQTKMLSGKNVNLLNLKQSAAQFQSLTLHFENSNWLEHLAAQELQQFFRLSWFEVAEERRDETSSSSYLLFDLRY